MDRGRKRSDYDSGEPPADKRPCTAEPSSSSATAAADVAAQAAGSDMDTSSSGRVGEREGDGESSCESDGGGSPGRCGRRGGGGRFQRMVAALTAEGAGESAQLAALTELCEALSFCVEDAGGYFPTEAAAPALVRLAGGGGSPEVMLVAVRAITYLCDAMPRASEAVVRHGALPVLCSPLLAIEYLDVAEQCLQALEKISKKQPVPCLQAGMISAVLGFIDFYPATIQRVAVLAVANVCKKVPTDCSEFVMESVPTLCNLLQYEDKKLVDTVATCLIRIVDSFNASPELLDELCSRSVLQKVLHLINSGGLSSLSQATCTNLIGLLTKLASSSLVAAKCLFELNVGSTIRGILVASDLSHGMPYSPFENVQLNLVHEALKLANQLIPPAARDVEDTQVVLAKEKILLDEPSLLRQFSKDILPVLIKAVNSGANSYICCGCASIVNNICYLSKSEILLDLLKETNISSFLAGLLARKDQHVLILSLKIVEILMQKLPDAYLGSFIKEGVVYAVEALLMQENCSESMPHLSNDMQQSANQSVSRNTSRCFCYAFSSCKSEVSEAKTCRIGKDSVFTFAKHVKTTYFTSEAVSSEMGLTEILQKLKTCCAVLNDTMDKSSNNEGLENEEHLTNILGEVMMELYGGETMTTFEFLESGLVRSLSNYLSNGKYFQENVDSHSSDHFLSVLKRFQSFARISFSKMDQGWSDMLLTLLVKKLQNALTSLDNFPVIVSHAFKHRNYISDIPVRHSTILPCLRVRFKKEEDGTCLSIYDKVVNVEVSSSLDTIEEYLWPKISRNMDKQQAESSTNYIALESKNAEDNPQTTDPKQESSASNSSEGTSEKGSSSSVQETCKQCVSTSGEIQTGTSAVIPSDHAVQPKLMFRLKGRELDRSITLYQSILQDQMNAGPDIVLGPDFWCNVHDVTFRSATNTEPGNPSRPSISWGPPGGSKPGFLWQTLPFFSMLLLAKLPCKLDKSSPSYDILFMLKVLEGLNRFSFHLLSDERCNAFAQGKITNFDDLKVTVSTVPQQEFVSTKLTEKLEQQMRDPLVLWSCCLPLWCTELMSACPFLFSFEARWKYFRLTTFRSSTVQHGHMLDPDSMENDRTAERGSYSRRKFKVDRGDILASAAEIMQSHARSKALLEVEYEEEVGTGLGPTMEFYTLISHAFQKPGLGMWRGELHYETGSSEVHDDTGFVAAPYGLFPRPWPAATSSVDRAPFSEVSKRFRLLGQVVAKAIKDGRILDLPFSKAFYKLILGQDLNVYDIQSFDPELARPLLEFQALSSRRVFLETSLRRDCHITSDLCYRGCRIEDLGIDFTLPGYPDYVLSSESSSKMVSIENLEDYIELVVEATVRSGIERQVEAFKSGFNEVFPLRNLQVFSEDELERLLCGEQDTWDFTKLVDHIKFDHGYTASSPPVINLLEIIQEFEYQQRRAFLQFVTGAPRLPPGGLAALNPKLTVVRKSSCEADAELPSVMTCANYLKLPPYSSKERMRERLLYAITEGQGCFHLS